MPPYSDSDTDTDSNDVREYRCELCKQTFTRLYNLKKHQGTNTHRANANQSIAGQNYSRELADINRLMGALNEKTEALNQMMREKMKQVAQPKTYNLTQLKELLTAQYHDMKDEARVTPKIRKDYKRHLRRIRHMQEEEKEQGTLFQVSLKDLLAKKDE